MPFRVPRLIALPFALLAPAAALVQGGTTAANAAPASVVAEDAAGGYSVSASSANVHVAPDTSSTIVGVAYQGDRLTCHDIEGSYGQTRWYHVTVDRTGVDGWVLGSLVQGPPEHPTKLL